VTVSEGQIPHVPLQFGQVIEGVGPAQFAGVDQAHEQVADVGAVGRLVEQRVLAVQDGPLQGAFAQIVIQGRPGHSQEQRQPFPVLEDVRDRPAQPRVGLDQPLVELPRQPGAECFHRRTALGLVKLQARLRRQVPLSGDGVVAVDHRQGLQHVAALLGKMLRHLDKLPPPVGQAVGHDRFQLGGQVPRERVAHLDRRGQLRRSLGQHVLQVLASVPAAAEEQRDPATLVNCFASARRRMSSSLPMSNSRIVGSVRIVKTPAPR